MKIKADRKSYKMSPEELATHLHIQRKGGVAFKSGKDYRRKPKHPKKGWD